jgi:hypothetical protein
MKWLERAARGLGITTDPGISARAIEFQQESPQFRRVYFGGNSAWLDEVTEVYNDGSVLIKDTSIKVGDDGEIHETGTIRFRIGN